MDSEQPRRERRTPAASSEEVARRMRATGRRDTTPEMALRSELHRRGLRYRVDVRADPSLRTRPDLVFSGPKVAVYVDSCFWHACPEHGTLPKTNAAWWGDKLTRNVERDRRANSELTGRGWHVIRVWEHEDVTDAADRVERAVNDRGS